MLLAFLIAAGAGGVLLAGLAIPMATATGTVTNSAMNLFNDLPGEIDPGRPAESSTILYSDGTVLATFYYQNRIVVPIDQISPEVQHAIVSIEDRRFYEHNGVDLEGMARALVNNAQGGDTEGASTLTQQYVKNVFMEQAAVIERQDPDAAAELYESATAQSYGRKLQEARYAIQVEKRYTKQQILEGYLNLAQFGPSVYGVEAASQHYFGHPAATLTVAEAALLAGLPQSPNNYDPLANPEGAKTRQTHVLDAMLRDGHIDQAQYDEAVAIPIDQLTANNQTLKNGCDAAGVSAYFCDYVVQELLQNPSLNAALGEDRGQRMQALFAGGLEVVTTIDPHTQQIAFESLTNTVPVNDPSGVNNALSAVEPGTGYIRAMVQNTNYGRNPGEGDPEQTVVNFNVGQSHGGGLGFQTGSTFKTFTLVEWLRTNHSLTQSVPAQQREYPRNSWTISCNPSYAAPYTANNIEGTWNQPNMSVLEATKLSINLPFVWMANQMDLCSIFGVAEAMGVERGDGAPLDPYPGNILGGNNNTPLSMANAYATIANDGVACEPIAITAITKRDGTALEVPGPQCAEAIPVEVARGVTHALRQPFTPGGTAQHSVLDGGRPAAGKTGTANEDYAAWFIGFTPQLASAVWTGHSEGLVSMFGSTINGRYYRLVYGSIIAAPVWKEFMDRALEGQEYLDFSEATERTIEGERKDVPSVIGMDPDTARTTLEDAGFSVTISQGRAHSNVAVGAVAAQSPSGRAAVGTNVVLTLSAGPAPAPPPPPAPEPAPEPEPEPEPAPEPEPEPEPAPEPPPEPAPEPPPADNNGNGNGNGGGNRGNGNG